jgi:hypothetical protein
LRGDCLLTYVIEGRIKRKIEVEGRRERRSKQLLDEREEKKGHCKLKEEAVEHTMWRKELVRES